MYVVDTLGTPPEPSVGASLTYIPAWRDNGPSLICFGGVLADREPSSACHIFDIENSKWSSPPFVGDPPSPRDCHSAVCWIGESGQERKVVVFGGMCGNWRTPPNFGRVNDVVVLDLGKPDPVAPLILHANGFSSESGTWSRPRIKGTAPKNRSIHAAGVIGSSMFIVGGLGVRPDPRLDISLYEKYGWSTATRSEGAQLFEPLRDLHLLDLGKVAQEIYRFFMVCLTMHGRYLDVERADQST